MGQAIAVRTDFTAGEVRRFATRAKDAAQARRLLIQFGKLRLLFAPRVFQAEAAHGFQRSGPRIDLAAQNALRFGDNLQEQEG